MSPAAPKARTRRSDACRESVARRSFSRHAVPPPELSSHQRCDRSQQLPRSLTGGDFAATIASRRDSTGGRSRLSICRGCRWSGSPGCDLQSRVCALASPASQLCAGHAPACAPCGRPAALASVVFSRLAAPRLPGCGLPKRPGTPRACQRISITRSSVCRLETHSTCSPVISKPTRWYAAAARTL